MDEKPDSTKEPEFQKVIRHFVTSAPKPHEEMRLKKPNAAASGEKSGKKKHVSPDGI